ncbi:MAG: F0F1 ATP synthase subunit alpha [Spirochaetaceae bacterium]|jgi:F-type H+-transporting ATPase subunit alpha|nr:F0F1 ATP synthase subunit alpha [Spirochaetaceae bacterium]
MSDFSELSTVLEKEIESWDAKPESATIGTVVTVGDGVATVDGLDKCVYGELVEFGSGSQGIVMNLNEESVGVVMLEGGDAVKDGEEARGTGKIVSVPVGDAVLGRIVNPLGEPVDGKGPISAKDQYPVESPAPPVIDRGAVDTPLQTGILSVDSMIPIGRGQRELIIGDRQTGKTAIAVDAIINQKGKDCYCVYCAIGQKSSAVAAIIESLAEAGAMQYTWVVLASASDSAALQYLAPYAACAMAEYFMKAGKDVLIIYDDLSKHAVAYRAISLLLRRPPGREAFPGDVFYLHSRLLERAAKLSDKLGGGSITALPIIETQAGDISSYIPTNVISITDGQIFLDSELFNQGLRPAVDVGLSVSRVGGSAQTKAVRKVSGQIRLSLAQYRDMASFAQFGSDLDKDTQDKLAQGSRLMECLKQPRYSPLAMEEEAVMLYAATHGLLMHTELSDVPRYIRAFLDYLREKEPQLLPEIAATKEISDDNAKAMDSAMDKYAAQTDATKTEVKDA